MCIADVIEAQRCEVVCPNFHSQLLAELGLELESLESKVDSGAREQAWVQTLYLRQGRPDQGWDLLPPSRGKSQGLDGRLRALTHLPKDRPERCCTEWDGGPGGWRATFARSAQGRLGAGSWEWCEHA